jgi:ABC-type phosphate/phosphonate transport system substrate-binding protein/serine phosphatase RsbU (regulator of sigma subunit)
MRQLRTILSALLCLIATVAASQETGARADTVRIGVLAHKGHDYCLQSWTPTAEFLTSEIANTKFEIVPLAFEDVNKSVQDGRVDFVIANSSIYVELEIKYWVSAIATMQNLALNKSVTLFGGVIFLPKSDTSIRSLQDLHGKRFAAVDETSLGGWRMAWRELARAGINPYKDFKALTFSNSHRAAAMKVKTGGADAGTVRTDTLERMAAQGEISLDDFRIIPFHGHGPDYEQFPFLLSTRLYPEWPIAKLRHVSDDLAKKVAASLFRMPSDSPAARSAAIAGWTIPLSYQAVHDLLKELKLGPYEYLGKVTLTQIIEQHRLFITAVALFLLFLIATTILVIGLNKNLRTSRAQLREELKHRKTAEEKLAASYSELEEVSNRVMESIEYAGTIQKALLPLPEHLKISVTDHFVLWSPRDIVGGDILWFKSSGHDFAVAVIDCTGHGVPGAMMSMLASTSLNRIVSESGYTDPATALENMNRLVKETLSRKRQGSLYDDGLDIGFLYADKTAGKAVFAGAKISLFCVIGNDVHEIKGDRQSIGYRSSKSDQSFTNHVFDLETVSAFYMTTDGLSDQVGGEKGFPLGKKSLKRFIVENFRKPFSEQAKILSDMFHSYKGDESRLDDVTVLGIRP